MKSPPIFRYINLKLASTCNLGCVYCYWFSDKTVYEKPSILTTEVEHAFFEKLEAHITEYGLDKFDILFHGGEPLMFGKRRFVRFMDSIELIQQNTGCKFGFSMTTNGTLLDKEWAQLLRIFNVHPTISIDGPPEIHDRVRPDLGGHGSFNNTVRGLNLLRNEGIEPGVLAVCDLNTDPEIITRYFIDILGIKHFDILVPDATHDKKLPSIAIYYKKLFDLWYDTYSDRGIDIRYPKSLLRGILGGETRNEGIGYGPIETLIMLTDGTLEPLDVLRIAGDGSTRTSKNIKTHTFQDVTSDPVWYEAYVASLNLCNTCKACEYHKACGGGYLPHRWSLEKRYDNVSVYCDDLKDIFDHIWKRVAPEIDVTVGNTTIPLLDALKVANISNDKT